MLLLTINLTKKKKVFIADTAKQIIKDIANVAKMSIDVFSKCSLSCHHLHPTTTCQIRSSVEKSTNDVVHLLILNLDQQQSVQSAKPPPNYPDWSAGS